MSKYCFPAFLDSKTAREIQQTFLEGNGLPELHYFFISVFESRKAGTQYFDIKAESLSCESWKSVKFPPEISIGNTLEISTILLIKEAASKTTSYGLGGVQILDKKVQRGSKWPNFLFQWKLSSDRIWPQKFLPATPQKFLQDGLWNLRIWPFSTIFHTIYKFPIKSAINFWRQQK